MIDETFKDYYKFPLIFKSNFLYVLTHDGKMALTWLIDSKEVPNSEEIINKMNGYSNKKFEKEWTIKENVFIYYGEQKMFLIRGWGMLTGSSSYHLNPSLAIKMQNNFGKYIVENLNK